MSHSLIEIPRSEWINLQKLYDKHRKDSSAWGLLQNYINWISIDPQIGAKIYSLDGEWKEDGLFLLIDADSHVTQVSFNTLSDNMDRLITALNCLNIKEAYILFAYPGRYLPVVKEHLKFIGLNLDEVRTDASFWFHIDKETALQFDVKPPEGITLAPLQLQNAEQVNSVWPHRSPGSVKFVERLIRFNRNVGAYDEDGNLVAWCLRLPMGSLGLLQVMDSHKRMGLGCLVVRYMARCLAQNNDETLAPVVTNNVASRSMFEKLGFKSIDQVYWSLKPDQEN